MLIIRKDLSDRIIVHSQGEFPNEACGILAGRANEVTKIYEMANVKKSPSSYFMDAKEQFSAMKDMRNNGLEMLGLYHSHVASKAYPSSRDVEMAFYPDASYVIVSLEDKLNPDIRSFKIEEGKITEEKIKVT